MKITGSLLCLALFASAPVAISAQGACLALNPVEDFDLAEYASRPWYAQAEAETAYTPPSQDRCVAAQYSLRGRRSFPWGYTVDVNNYAEDQEGNSFGGDLCAAYDDEGRGALRVAPCFLPQAAAGPYWVVAYDEDAGYALVSGGQPTLVVEGEDDCGPDGASACCKTGDGVNNSGLWIFTRAPDTPAELVDEVRSIAKGLGLSTSVLFDVDQSGCDFPTFEQPPACLPVDTVADFDLAAYASRPWYVQMEAENAYTPPEQDRCVTAQYSLRRRKSFPWGYTVDVNNYAEDREGNSYGGDLCADFDEHDPSKLRVAPCFLPQAAAGPYWVVAYDEDAGYALVSGGQPEDVVEGEGGCGPDGAAACCKTGDGWNNSGLWIFTRAPEPPAGLVEEVQQIAKELGFATSVLFDVDQSDCTVPAVGEFPFYLRKES